MPLPIGASYRSAVHAVALLSHSGCNAYFLPLTSMITGSVNGVPVNTLLGWNTTNTHSSAISSPNIPPDEISTQLKPSGSVIVSINSWERTSSVESINCPFGLRSGRTWQPTTFAKGSTEYSTCAPVSLKVTLL